jgi:hypothetical protein
MTFLLKFLLTFVVLAVTALICFILATRNKTWADRAHIAGTISGVAVVLALVLGAHEYVLHYHADMGRKKQAVLDILRTAIGNERLDNAYHALYDDHPHKVLNMEAAVFDQKIASLSDLYWAAGACVDADLCDEDTTRKVFCFDFLTYKVAYCATHPEGQRWQDLNDLRLRVFKGCSKDDHRFKPRASDC